MSETKEENLLEQFFKVQSLLHKFHLQNHKSHGFFRATHRGQGRVLSMLKIKPEITQKELSYLLDMRPQSLGELLSKLENQQFITRTHSEKDRRVMVVKLTSKGMDEINKNEKREDPTNQIFNVLEPEEKSTLSYILTKITNELERTIKSEDGNNFDEAHMQPPPRPHHGQYLGGFAGRDAIQNLFNSHEGYPDFPNREDLFEQMVKQHPELIEQLMKQHPEFFTEKELDRKNSSKNESEQDIDED
ncbi:MarR family transcriptional regulator [Clostridioides difficile]